MNLESLNQKDLTIIKKKLESEWRELLVKVKEQNHKQCKEKKLLHELYLQEKQEKESLLIEKIQIQEQLKINEDSWNRMVEKLRGEVKLYQGDNTHLKTKLDKQIQRTESREIVVQKERESNLEVSRNDLKIC